MENNVGGYDVLVRWMLAGGLGVYGFMERGWRRDLALSAASNIAWTAITLKCPINQALGINSNTRSEQAEKTEADIQETSEESFPASDAPAWAGHR